MCEIMNKLNRKAADEALAEDRRKNALEMIKDGQLSFEQIAKYTNLTIDEFKALADGETAYTLNRI